MKDICGVCFGIGEVYYVQLDAVSTCTCCNGTGKVERDDLDDFYDDEPTEDTFVEFDENKHSLNQGDEDED